MSFSLNKSLSLIKSLSLSNGVDQGNAKSSAKSPARQRFTVGANGFKLRFIECQISGNRRNQMFTSLSGLVGILRSGCRLKKRSITAVPSQAVPALRSLLGAV